MIRRLAVGVGDVLFALGLVLAVVTFWFAVTWFPCGVCLLVAAAGLAVRLLAQRPRRRRLGVGAAVALGSLGAILVGSEMVRHAFRKDARLESRYENPTLADTVLGIVPEGDLASLGVKGSRLFGVWPAEQMDEIHPLLCTEYEAMREDGAFAYVGNAAAAGYVGDSGHRFFRYLPEGYSIERKQPLLVFLHGAGGNLALQSWLWSKFADVHGFVVLCPTWGNGRWETQDGTKAALDALDDTLRSCSIDEGQVWLAGHSNGAIGGWAVLAARPGAFRGFVCISGSRGPDFDAEAVRGVPTLLLHGGRERAIPVTECRRLYDSLERQGRSVRLIEFPDDDHFLMLRSSKKIHDVLWEWMQAHSAREH